MRRNIPPPQRSSLRSGLCCPDPSSLNRPHPPRSQAHRNFTARRLICDAFAVRERLGDPRAVPGFRCPFFPDMPSSATPGEFDIDQFQAATSTLAFAKGAAARHSQNSRNPFPAGGSFRGFHGSHICYGLSVCSAPCTDLTGLPANGAFYIQAFNESVALLIVGYDYSIDWTPMLVGLSPTRMAASLAARSSPSRCGPATAMPFRSNPRSPSFRCDPFARDVALDPGRASAPRMAVPHMLPSSE
jgi:hypothetical protein